MADMLTQIRIQADAAGAAAEVENLKTTFEDAKTEIEGSGEALDESAKSASTAADEFAKAAEEADELANAKTGIDSLAESLDSLERQAKKLGRDWSTLVTAPIAALAGISLKNLYDEGAMAGSTGKARELAIAVQDLVRNFKDLAREIGTSLSPVFLRIVGVANTVIDAYRSLSTETKNTITTVALIAAAVGPAILAFSSLASILVKTAPVVKAIGVAIGSIASLLSTPVVLITALGTTLAGLINVFFRLREAGVNTAEALKLSFDLFVTGFNNFVVKNILKGVSLIVSGLSSLSGVFSSSISKGLDSANTQIKSWISTLDSSFQSTKGQIDSSLQTIGSSAGEAFTFGLSTKISDAIDKMKSMFSDASSNYVIAGETQEEIEARLNAFRNAEEEYAKMLEQRKQTIAQFSESISQSISGGMTSALMDFANGTKDAAAAFADFARQTVSNLLTIATQALIMNALFPPGSPMGNMIAAFSSAFARVPQYAKGGLVSGPGSGTSDSIIARLSNGEFVNDAKTVRHFGVGFFENLKAMARGGVPIGPRGAYPGFADGGLVRSSSQAPQIVLENKGSEKSVVSSSYDPETAVMTVVLDDLGRNGPISKGIQNTFGIGRGGFR